MRRLEAVLCAAALAFIGVAVASARSPAVHPARATVLLDTGDGNSANLKVRPATVGYTGDGTGLMAGHGSSVRHPGRIHWTRWSHGSARGRGYAWLNNCQPGCYNGHFHPVRATIAANRPRHGRFTHLAIRYSTGGADYRRLRWVAGDQYGPGYWEWSYATH